MLNKISKQKKVSKKSLGSIVTIAALLAMVVFVVLNWAEIQSSLSIISFWQVVLVSIIFIPAMVLRIEAWRVSIKATNDDSPRKPLYIASSMGFAAANINGVMGTSAQVVSFNKISKSNLTIPQLLATMAPILWMEMIIMMGFIIVSFTTLDIPSFVLPFLMLAIPIGFILMKVLFNKTDEQKSSSHWFKGFSIVKNKKSLLLMGALLFFYFSVEILRLWLVLDIMGISVNLFSVIAAFVSIAVLGAMQLGAASIPAALTAIFSSKGAELAISAGLILSASALLITILAAITASLIILAGRIKNSSTEVINTVE